MNTVIETTTATAQVRFNNALKAVRKVGVATRVNFSSCCRSCAVLPEDKVTLWTFGGQGNAYAWFEGTMVNRSELAKLKARVFTVTLEKLEKAKALETEVYFNFTDIIAAEAAVICFEAEGFEVDWDGTDLKCVVVKM